ncbi:MAG: pyrroloquinoline quinone biosynthesis protein [Planctomycetota bacterium]|nr:MAG: pyrroloquinoline quinone biosynthesis protein [Planctomycetota bacterium]
MPSRLERPCFTVLGIAQDAGLPQAGCRRRCCAKARRDPQSRRRAACAAVASGGKSWLIDATPDFREQLAALDGATLEGVFLTHGHMGHYAGLLQLGREAMNARGVAVHAMKRMAELLRRNAPWEQLVRNKNIDIRPLRAGRSVPLRPSLSITPVPVPHRAEYTETVAFRVAGPRRSVLWLPDIDRWDQWEQRLEDAIAEVDAAWLDATFFSLDELPFRPTSEVPHPPLSETLERLSSLPTRERAKVRFVHLNHTNPAHNPRSREGRLVKARGFRVAEEGERFLL